MAEYRFVTVWRLRAPIDVVFAAIDDAEAWPDWWPNVKRVERLAEPNDDGVGAVMRMAMAGRLPYALRFEMRVVKHEPPASIVGTATGELEGVGTWTLHEENGWTVVRYVWEVRTTARWMNALAPLPFVDAIFRFNHHAVMRGGLTGIRKRLGGVDGTYTREE